MAKPKYPGIGIETRHPESMVGTKFGRHGVSTSRRPGRKNKGGAV